MIALERPVLSAKAATLFLRRSTKIAGIAASVRAEFARSSWKNRHGKTFDAAVQLLADVAPGRSRCMYCLDSLGCGVDHYRPVHLYPEFTFDWLNYVWSCAACNSSSKSGQFPVAPNGAPLLVNPLDDDPADHFVLIWRTGRLEPTSQRGAATERVVPVNSQDACVGRQRFAASMFVLGAAALASSASFSESVMVGTSLEFASIAYYFLDSGSHEAFPSSIDEDAFREFCFAVFALSKQR